MDFIIIIVVVVINFIGFVYTDGRERKDVEGQGCVGSACITS